MHAYHAWGWGCAGAIQGGAGRPPEGASAERAGQGGRPVGVRDRWWRQGLLCLSGYVFLIAQLLLPADVAGVSDRLSHSA